MAALGSTMLTKLPKGLATKRTMRLAKPGDSVFQAAMDSICDCSYAVKEGSDTDFFYGSHAPALIFIYNSRREKITVISAWMPK